MSGYGSIVAEQAESAATMVLSKVQGLDLHTAGVNKFFKSLSLVFKKYGKWCLVAVLFRVLYDILLRSKGSSRPKLLKKKKKTADDADESSEEEQSSFFLDEEEIPSPARNHIIETDDVVVVNRDDKFLEVYSKKNSHSMTSKSWEMDGS